MARCMDVRTRACMDMWKDRHVDALMPGSLYFIRSPPLVTARARCNNDDSNGKATKSSYSSKAEALMASVTMHRAADACPQE